MKIEYLAGQGPGGQHMQKNATTVRATDTESGVSVIVRGRYRHKNLKLAKKRLAGKLAEMKETEKSATKAAERIRRIREQKTIRTYHYPRGIVKDHRSKKSVPLQAVLSGKVNLRSLSNA